MSCVHRRRFPRHVSLQSDSASAQSPSKSNGISVSCSKDSSVCTFRTDSRLPNTRMSDGSSFNARSRLSVSFGLIGRYRTARPELWSRRSTWLRSRFGLRPSVTASRTVILFVPTPASCVARIVMWRTEEDLDRRQNSGWFSNTFGPKASSSFGGTYESI